jgi:phenylacetate-coenzyme A ligase PaaK-like adenylate-forming protein
MNSRRTIESYRDRSLRLLLRHARQFVPFQQSRLDGIDLQRIRLEDIPPTDKSAMMASFDATIAGRAVTFEDVLLTDSGRLELPVIHGRYIVMKTSGTSGRPSWLVCGMRDWAILLAATYARETWQWLTVRRLLFSTLRPVRTATVAAEHSHSMPWQAVESARRWTGPSGRVRFFSVVDSVQRIVAGLNEFRPHHLHAYSTAAEMLARHRLDGAAFTFEPELITVGSEPLTAIARETIRQAFPAARIVEHYGMSECLPLATECPQGRKHVNSDYAILEPRDAQDRPVPIGELSDHILITNLVNRVQPIIRYRVDDSVRISVDACPCGSVLPVVEIVSRKGSLIHLRSDAGPWQILSPPIAVDTMLRARGVAQYQIVHLCQNELEVRYLPLKGADPRQVAESIQEQFSSVLSSLGCACSVSVRVTQVEKFDRAGVGGKLQQMISLVAAPAAATWTTRPGLHFSA